MRGACAPLRRRRIAPSPPFYRVHRRLLKAKRFHLKLLFDGLYIYERTLYIYMYIFPLSLCTVVVIFALYVQTFPSLFSLRAPQTYLSFSPSLRLQRVTRAYTDDVYLLSCSRLHAFVHRLPRRRAAFFRLNTRTLHPPRLGGGGDGSHGIACK